MNINNVELTSVVVDAIAIMAGRKKVVPMIEMVRVLLHNGANVNDKDRNDCIALHYVLAKPRCRKAESYGDRASIEAEMAKPTGKSWPKVGRRIHSELPYIEAEVRFAAQEYAKTAVDVIARRLRISFLNVTAAEEALESIVKIMAEELNWTKEKQAKQMKEALLFMETEMGLHHEIQDGRKHQCTGDDNRDKK